ncbi:uncharacterized protein LOC122549515 [Chiloscyllium plagiosum]|uniref:uncharacterized protein LOC122549515 n=1 Tax=Chiloscyllium plagiosum TaxID=36176 RepID=UPI001CB7D2BD|nr:uncharacterized protein LOC122549515 [Chiloscyllium plagiosum]
MLSAMKVPRTPAATRRERAQPLRSLNAVPLLKRYSSQYSQPNLISDSQSRERNQKRGSLALGSPAGSCTTLQPAPAHYAQPPAAAPARCAHPPGAAPAHCAQPAGGPGCAETEAQVPKTQSKIQFNSHYSLLTITIMRSQLPFSICHFQQTCWNQLPESAAERSFIKILWTTMKPVVEVSDSKVYHWGLEFPLTGSHLIGKGRQDDTSVLAKEGIVMKRNPMQIKQLMDFHAGNQELKVECRNLMTHTEHDLSTDIFLSKSYDVFPNSFSSIVHFCHTSVNRPSLSKNVIFQTY